MRILAAIALLFTGCASTTLYSHGQKVATFQGNMDGLVFHYSADGSIEWSCAKVNHSIATRAGGSVGGTILSGVTGGITAAGVFAK